MYSLSTRLLPGIAGGGGRHVGFNRLYAPIGYWNGLGALTAIGILVTLGLIAHGERRVRIAGCAALVVEAPVLYLTFSRGSAAALVVGLAAAVALETRRLRFAACSAAAFAAPILAVLTVYLRPALTSSVPHHHAATVQGAEAAVVIALLVAGGAFAGRWIDDTERWIRPTPEQRRQAGYALAGLALVPILVVLIAGGGPVRMGRDVLGTAGAPAPTFRHGDLNLRYLSLSANGRTEIWHAAIKGFAAHPLIGSGAGSFPRRWLRVRGGRPPVAQAHSIELSVLSELGIVGGALLLVALAVPVRSAVRMRTMAVVPALGGAYTAFLLATGLDWTWQLAGVTMAGLACAAGLVSSDTADARRPSPATVRSVLAAGLAAGLVGIVLTAGSAEISRAKDSLSAGRFSASRSEAARAATLQPWAAEPWLVAGYADLGLNRHAAALASAHRALSADAGDVRGWILLACLTRHDVRRAAAAQARTLDPGATAFSGPHFLRCLPPYAALRRTD
jgi:O-antigen ligase